MKKIILMVLATTLAFSLVACTGNSNNSQNPNSIPNSSDSEKQEVKKNETYMGQISEKVGNDITLSLGKLIIENDGGDGQTMMVDENGNQVPVEGGMENNDSGESIMIPMPDDAGAEGNGNTTVGGEIEKLPIEFTGEIKEFTIPAGAKIVNAAGKEITLDSIKKGSLVQLIVDATSGVVETVMAW